LDRCGRYGAVEYVSPLVVTGWCGPVVLEPVDGSFDFVAAPVVLTVETSRPSAVAAPVPALGTLVPGLRNGELDLELSKAAAVAARIVCLVSTDVAGRVRGLPPIGRGTRIRSRRRSSVERRPIGPA
jgi:hypothetical protein